MKLTPANCRIQLDAVDTKPGRHGVSVGFQHEIPPGLNHNGCMWIFDDDDVLAETGTQGKRCPDPVKWLFGLDRVYCEKHGQVIYARSMKARGTEAQRSRESRLAKKRRRKAKENGNGTQEV